jgi:hypothetical protein
MMILDMKRVKTINFGEGYSKKRARLRMISSNG